MVNAEPCLGSLIKITRQQRRPIMPNLINVLNNDERLAHRLPLVDQNRDFLMNRVHLQKKRDLFSFKFSSLDSYVLNTLFSQGNSHPRSKRTCPHIKQNQFVLRHCYSSAEMEAWRSEQELYRIYVMGMEVLWVSVQCCRIFLYHSRRFYDFSSLASALFCFSIPSGNGSVYQHHLSF